MITPETQRVFELQAERFGETFCALKPWLPDLVHNFLDIGCGLGGIAMLVSLHYGGQAHAHLIDAGRPGEKWTRYRADGQPWCDVGVALSLFNEKWPGARVTAWPPRADAQVPPCELIYSTCSWGHHYSIETYMPLAERCLKPGGRLIVDLRKHHANEFETILASRFSRVSGIEGLGKKYRRTIWTRGPHQ